MKVFTTESQRHGVILGSMFLPVLGFSVPEPALGAAEGCLSGREFLLRKERNGDQRFTRQATP